MEIGSIFEIDPAVVSAVKEKSFAETVVWNLQLKEAAKYQKQEIQYTASAREAIVLALRSMARNRGWKNGYKRCLLPAYMCDSVFHSFAREGWEITFYHVGCGLEPDWEELQALTNTCRPHVILLHPYYGADTCAQGRALLRVWRSRRICIMEDVTQSYYLGCAGRDADYVVASLRKWYPVPDGGFVAADEKLATEEVRRDEDFAEKKLEVMVQKWNYLHTHGDVHAKNRYLQKNRELEVELDGCCQIRTMSGMSAAILAELDEAECKRRRAENALLLRLGIRQDDLVWPVSFGTVSGECQQAYAPLYFVIYAKERDCLQRYLSEQGIYAPVLWPVSDANSECLKDNERWIYKHLLALPMDQRYGREQMQAVIKAVNSWGGF